MSYHRYLISLFIVFLNSASMGFGEYDFRYYVHRSPTEGEKLCIFIAYKKEREKKKSCSRCTLDYECETEMVPATEQREAYGVLTKMHIFKDGRLEETVEFRKGQKEVWRSLVSHEVNELRKTYRTKE